MPPVTFCISSAVAASILLPGVGVGGDDQVLQHLGVGRIDQLRIDLDPPQVALAVQGHPDQAGAGLALTSMLSSLACISCIFDCICCACFIRPAGSSFVHLHGVSSRRMVSASGRLASGGPAAAARRHRPRLSCTVSIRAPGNASRIARTSG